ncbi:MAG: hypothetical protein M1419_02425 [Bacteroidetes bacterium]|nr:hypothetical protein [Bacteroidota bacterium]
MKNSKKKVNKDIHDDLLPEYDFDFTKSKPNPYTAQLRKQENLVKLEPDIAKVFKTSEDVNNILRAIIKSYPKRQNSSYKTA